MKKIIFLILLMVLISGCTPGVEETKTTVKEPIVESKPVLLPSCSDGVKNQNETDADCGGNCPACRDNKSCVLNKDCINLCVDGVCGLERKPKNNETETDYVDMKENAINLVKEKLTKGTRTKLSENYKKLKIGEKYVFGFGVNNIFTKKEDFNITLNFNKAYDYFNNKIDVDSGVVMGWIDAELKTFSLEPHQNKIFLIGVEVKNTTNRVKKGTYVFDISVFMRQGGLNINEEYDSKKQINIKVE